MARSRLAKEIMVILIGPAVTVSSCLLGQGEADLIPIGIISLFAAIPYLIYYEILMRAGRSSYFKDKIGHAVFAFKMVVILSAAVQFYLYFDAWKSHESLAGVTFVLIPFVLLGVSPIFMLAGYVFHYLRWAPKSLR